MKCALIFFIYVAFISLISRYLLPQNGLK